MAVAAEHRNGALLERMADLIRASGRGGDARAKFARLIFSHADEAELQDYTPEALAALAISAWEFVRQRKPQHHRIRTFNPDKLSNGQRSLTVVEILNDDMPFLLDSIMGEILEQGLDVRLVVHPVFIAARDDAGKLRSVSLPRTDADAAPAEDRESYIQIHIERLDDEPSLEKLKQTLSGVLSNVRTVVRDWKPMVERLNRAVAAYTETPPPVPVADLAESIQFLKWLANDHFTFLGMRAMAFVGGAREGRLEPAPDTGLGLLRDPEVAVLRRGADAVHMTPEIRKFFLAPEPLIVTKANVRSTVHRRVHMDYIGVKIYRETGEISGELRIVGLFTSAAYTRSVKSIPFLRHKVETVRRRASFDPHGHSGKRLQNVLETFPRDELFQIGSDLLYDTALGILALTLKPRVRVFARIDEFDRFVSVLVYVPRDRFSTQVRLRIGTFLAEAFKGRVSAYYPYIPDGPLVRIHFIVGRSEGKTPAHDQAWLEEEVRRIVRTWQDRLERRLNDTHDAETARRHIRRYRDAFPAGYQETVSPDRALEDIARMERLAPDTPVAVDVYRDGEPDLPHRVRVTLYCLDEPIPLSRRVPILENLGFDVVYERSYEVTPDLNGETRKVALHDMAVGSRDIAPVDIGEQGRRIEACFLAVWRGQAANDGFNRLVLCAGMDWRQAALFRAYGSYLRQIRAPFGQAYLADTLVRHASVARDLLELFAVRFDPDSTMTASARADAVAEIVARIETALESIPSLDEDRIVRHYRNLICSTTRTNFHARDGAGGGPEIVFKFDSEQVDGAPSPRPFAEIFVAGPRVEGIHLRYGPIARGGVRWSDRLQDYRTEVLSLAKAQQVKNVVIVPTGAKGGFVPKLLPAGGAREEIQAEAVAAYKSYVAALLSLTDNIEGDETVPPARVVRHDADDPYLVVAADKGTAAFSDIANEISTQHGFWLGDAFASGGSAGYDHKKMGITARGAWEAVKRHFREMDVDIQTTPFTAVGVGDMSGDVFGNGMLLSKTIKLLAAFDHRDIFIDPDPDREASWRERKRLFDLPRSSWQDYDKETISAGGGVFSRSAKSVPLSDAMRALTGLDQDTATPTELMRAVLRAPADLMWFGGIGTFVKASGEADADVGDRTNDALRVLARELRAKVVGEGANLAMTQAARIEFARGGGRVNTDAIDNSAGVNSSDLEVNIKIALRPALDEGRLDRDGRNALLAEMTEEVAQSCLRTTYLQSLALSMGERRGLADLPFQARLIRALERSGLLDPGLEGLPGKAELEERQAQGEALMRPELAVLLAYAKLDLTDELIRSEVPDDPYFAVTLQTYFPATLRERFGDDLAAHKLRREIVATELANAVINRGGSTMVVRLRDETGHSAAEVTLACTAASAVFGLRALWAGIDALDNRVPGQLQLGLYVKVQDALREQTGWFLRHVTLAKGLTDTIELYRSGVSSIVSALESVLTEEQNARRAEERQRLADAGIEPDLAGRLSALPYLADAPDAIYVAEATARPVAEIARLFSEAAAFFRVHELRRAGGRLGAGDRFDRLALNSLNGVLSAALRTVVKDAVHGCEGQDLNFEIWREQNAAGAARARAGIDEILETGDLTLSRLMVAATHVRDLVPA